MTPLGLSSQDERRALSTIRLHEKQGIALTSPATEMLYGGAAGGGKSYLLRAAAIHWCISIPGLQCYIFRRNFKDLIQSHMEGPQGFPILLRPLVDAGKCKIVQQEIRFSNGSRIYLRHLQHEKDVYSYLSAEIHLLMFDELTTFSVTMYKFLRGRLRLGGLTIPPQYKHLFPRIICGSNPGNVGHGWVKKMFVKGYERSMTLRRMRPKDGGMIRQYVPALMTDNPTLVLNDPDYVNKVEGLGDPALVKAMKDGDWNIVAGAMFEQFREERHVIKPFPIPSHWKIWRGADDGFAAPSVVEWLTQDPLKKTVYCIEELHKAGMFPQEFARRTVQKDREIKVYDVNRFGDKEPWRYLDRILEGNLDTSAFDETGESEVTRGKQLNNLGCNWHPVPKWNGSRIAGIQEVHRLLAANPDDPRNLGRKTEDMIPGIQFFNSCQSIIETLPELPRSDKDVEDISDEADDHDFDALRYALQWHFPFINIGKTRGL